MKQLVASWRVAFSLPAEEIQQWQVLPLTELPSAVATQIAAINEENQDRRLLMKEVLALPYKDRLAAYHYLKSLNDERQAKDRRGLRAWLQTSLARVSLLSRLLRNL